MALVKKKLVLFIGGLNFGGMERVVFIAEKLLREEYDTTIVTLYQSNADYRNIDAKLYDLNVPPKNGKINKVIVFCKRLMMANKMKHKLKPDIVFSFGMYSNYLNALSKKREKIVMGIRSYDWLNTPFTCAGIDNWIVKKFDSVNCVSKMIYKDVDNFWPDINKSRIIYNPYDVNYITEQSKLPIDDYVFEPNKFYFITMGRLSHQKAFDHLIKAFYIVNKKVKNSHLIILGDGQLKNELSNIIHNLNLENKVELLGAKSNPYRYIARSNVYVLSSYTEGFPNALVEAMSLAVPVVSVDCKSGPSEILFENMQELDWEKKDIKVADYGIITKEMLDLGNHLDYSLCEQSLANGMIYAFNNYENMKSIAINGKARVEKFDYSLFKEELLDELSSL